MCVCERERAYLCVCVLCVRARVYVCFLYAYACVCVCARTWGNLNYSSAMMCFTPVPAAGLRSQLPHEEEDDDKENTPGQVSQFAKRVEQFV